MSIKKSVHPRTLPGVHPGLEQKIREAEDAELRGETPRRAQEAQKIIRPAIDTVAPDRRAQVRTIGLVEPAYRAARDGLAELAQQDPYRPGVDLDQIWDTMGEAEKIRAGAIERFRLEMEASLRLAAMPWQPPHKIGGRLDARALARSSRNLHAELAAFAYLLAPDSLQLLERFVDETRRLMELCLRQRAVEGIEAPVMHDILRDLVEKLIYQELNSRRRAMGERGIRRICGNIEIADELYSQLKRYPDVSPRERLLLRIIFVHQDLGYSCYAARVSYRGGKLHRAYAARIFTDELNRFRPLLRHKELEQARTAVATHSFNELPIAQARILGITRAIDHLAPFARYRVYEHLQQVEGASDYLDDLLERARAGDLQRYAAAKDALAELLLETDMPPALRDDIWSSFRAIERGAEMVELGELAGNVESTALSILPPGRLEVSLAPAPFAKRYQSLFDQQQGQLVRLARASGLKPEDLHAGVPLELGAEDFGKLALLPAV